MTTTAEATLARHPHAFAVIVFERPADERFSVDMVASNDVPDEMLAAMIRGVALKFGDLGDAQAVTTLDAVRTVWEVLQGADRDRLSGRAEDEVLEELALARTRMDELLGTVRQEGSE